MRLARAEFVTSVPVGGALPGGEWPSVALVGRSNVGKSSLINALLKKRVARAGAKPGTTRLLNVYRVETSGPGGRTFLLIDLPGYGYARGGARSQDEFRALTEGFFSRATTEGAGGLRAVLVLVDVRHPGLAADLGALAWARELGPPVLVAATKADRLSRAAATRAGRAQAEALGQPVVLTSSRTGLGLDRVWAALREALST